MSINAAGLAIIKFAEAGAGINAKHTKGPKKGRYMFRECYLDGGGVPTIGYGNTSSVTRKDVGVKVITEAEADALLVKDTASTVSQLEALLLKHKIKLNENEFSALGSLTFNIGVPAFASSTAFKRLKAGNKAGCAEAMQWFNKDGTGPGGALEVQPGLVTRRKAESDLFLTPV